MSINHPKQFKLFTAFSRPHLDDPATASSAGRYVQDEIRVRGREIFNLLTRAPSEGRKAFIFIAGKMKDMPDQVTEALVDVIAEHGNVSEGDAAEMLCRMKRRRLFLMETY